MCIGDFLTTLLEKGKIMDFDCIVVGSGFSGSVIARKNAENGKKVLIIEQRPVIAGNMYDERDKDGILIQKYGPHVFHTSDDRVYNFLREFSEWDSYTIRNQVSIKGKTYPSPFNFKFIDDYYNRPDGERLKRKLSLAYPEKEKVTVIELLEQEDKEIREFAETLFELDYRPYTSKQWGMPPEKIDVSILKRCPVFLSYRENYFDEKYECLPRNGYTELFQKILAHKNITLWLNTNALDVLEIDIKEKSVLFQKERINVPVIYTGSIDALFKYQWGELPYRSLRFDYKELPFESYQEAPVVVHPLESEFTRITEYTKLPYQKTKGKTVIAVEYPVSYKKERAGTQEPFYPIINKENMEIYQCYKKMADEISNLYLCGRLADYKYYNMDQAVERAFEVYQKIQDI